MSFLIVDRESFCSSFRNRSRNLTSVCMYMYIKKVDLSAILVNTVLLSEAFIAFLIGCYDLLARVDWVLGWPVLRSTWPILDTPNVIIINMYFLKS